MRRTLAMIVILLIGGAAVAVAEGIEGVLTAGNGIYRVHVSDDSWYGVGTYTATTGPAHPAGEGLNVFFGSGEPGTTFNTVRSWSTRTDYVFGSASDHPSPFAVVSLDPYGKVSSLGGQGLRTVFVLPGPPATPDALTIVSDVAVQGSGYEESAITVETRVTNDGPAPVALGIRYLWDFQIGQGELGGDDGPTFQTVDPAGPVLVTESEFLLPWFGAYRIVDNDINPDPPTFFLLGTVNGPAGLSPTPPDLLQFVAWPLAYYSTAFEYAVDPGLTVATEDEDGVSPWSGGDSAVLYYFGSDPSTAFLLPPGGEARSSASLYLTRPFITVPVDVKPGSDRNPLNAGERGVVPVAIPGARGFAVEQIDPDTVALEGVPALRFAYEDVPAPVRDEIPDLTLKFDAQALVRAVRQRLGRNPFDGERVELHLTGTLRAAFGAVPLEGADTVTFLVKKGR